MIDLTELFIKAIDIRDKGIFDKTSWHQAFVSLCDEYHYIDSGDIDEERWGRISKNDGILIYRDDIPLLFFTGDLKQPELIKLFYPFEFISLNIVLDKPIYSINPPALKNYFGRAGDLTCWNSAAVDINCFIFEDFWYMTHDN